MSESSATDVIAGTDEGEFGSVPAVPAACTGNALLTDEGCAVNGFESFEDIHFWKTPESDCFGDGGECVPYSDWVTAYNEIKNL